MALVTDAEIDAFSTEGGVYLSGVIDERDQVSFGSETVASPDVEGTLT